MQMQIHGSMYSFLCVHKSPILCRHEWTSGCRWERRRRNTININAIASSSSSGEYCDDGQKKPLLSVIRRSANYKPPNWEHALLHSLKTQYDCSLQGQKFEERSSELKKHVKMMFQQQQEKEINTTVYYLELIDTLQRLGIFYHFQDEIHFILSTLHQQINCSKTADYPGRLTDLYATALGFRLLRQHHFDVSQDMFDWFVDEKGEFDTRLIPNINGLIQIYEASFYQKENENILEMGRNFAYKHLNEKLGFDLDEGVQDMILHSLEQPFHWRMPRLEARLFMNLYEKKKMNDNSPESNTVNEQELLLELAKLDFNTVQVSHLNDLQILLKWWKKERLPEVLPFSRDRVVESLYVAIGVVFEPEFREFRQMLVKAIAVISTIDDVYDIYATLDELQLFTQAVERWDKDAIDELPDYMKHCCNVLYNLVNENALVLELHGINVVNSLLRKSWIDFCRANLNEAKWYYSGYTPTLEEYLENSLFTIGAPLLLLYSYFFVTDAAAGVEKKNIDMMEEIMNIRYHNIIRCAGIIFRLADDLGTSSDEIERGDNSKAIQCYMNESGCTEEEGREHIKSMIGEMWKEMNKHVEEVAVAVAVEEEDNKEFIGVAMNLARMGQCLYQNGDGFGNRDSITMAQISSLLFQPLHTSG